MAIELRVNLPDTAEMRGVAHSFAENSGQNASESGAKWKTAEGAIEGWQAIGTAPRDASVLVAVEPTEDNKTFASWPVQVHAAYIDEDGNVLNYETLSVDPGLYGQFWRATHWHAFPEPPVRPRLNEGAA